MSTPLTPEQRATMREYWRSRKDFMLYTYSIRPRDREEVLQVLSDLEAAEHGWGYAQNVVVIRTMELAAERELADALAKVLDKLRRAANVMGQCPDHGTGLRHPLCANCQLHARKEEAEDMLDRWRVARKEEQK